MSTTPENPYNVNDTTQLQEALDNRPPEAPLENPPAPSQPTFTPGDGVDMDTFVRAQARFISEQTIFIGSQANFTSSADFTNAMARYSREQTLMMGAQHRLLRQLGVV